MLDLSSKEELREDLAVLPAISGIMYSSSSVRSEPNCGRHVPPADQGYAWIFLLAAFIAEYDQSSFQESIRADQVIEDLSSDTASVWGSYMKFGSSNYFPTTQPSPLLLLLFRPAYRGSFQERNRLS
jgi:hypothetical protein